MKKGFTLVEVLLALSGVAVLAIGSTSFLFSILGQRDQAVAESLASEQAEAVFSLVGTAVRSAQGIQVTNEGRTLELTGESECFKFSWDNVEERLMFGRVEGVDCEVPLSAGEQLTSEKTAIKGLNFSLLDLDDSSRTVGMEMEVVVFRPLWNTSQTFDQLFVNLVDEEVEE